MSDNVNYDYFLNDSNCNDGGGGGPEPTPVPPPTPYCEITTRGGQGKNLHAPQPSDSISGTIPPYVTVYILRSPYTSDGHTWYYINYGDEFGWLDSITTIEGANYSNIPCTPSNMTVDQLPGVTPTLVPTPTEIPPPSCTLYKFEGGVMTFKPFFDRDKAPLYKNLLPPCAPGSITDPIQYDGISIPIDSSLDKQYGIMEEASSEVSEHIRDLHFGPTDPTPLITPRPTKPEPKPENFSDPQAYQDAYSDWFPLWGDTANGDPTEETREDYEQPKILNADFNSCGFFTLWYAMGSLGILDRNQIRPYQLMANAAEEHAQDKDYFGNYSGVNLTRSGFAWNDFLNEVGYGIAHMTNAQPLSDATVDEIAELVRTPNTAVMVIVRIDENNSSNSIEADGQSKKDDHLLSDDSELISHWIIVTGVSPDNRWFRVLNPLNNQIEYYNQDEFRLSRNAGNGDVLIITG